MGICGVAIDDDRPVSARELDRMCLRMGAHAKDSESLVLPHVGFSSTVSGSTSFSDDLWVASEADLCSQGALKCGSAAQFIASLYRKHGTSFLEKLKGAFAFALWDQRQRMLMLAVDRFGIKRLCYAHDRSGIQFATTPTGIVASQRIPKNVNLSSITDYFCYSVVPTPKTAFEGIYRLAPGEYLRWTKPEVRTRRYWDMHYSENAGGNPRDLAEELLSRMKDAVGIASAGLTSSQTGCFLSGGTDSSSIVGLLTEIHNAPVKAFSVGFAEDRFNELEYARLAAKHFSATHVEGRLRSEDARQVIETIIAGYDEPFANSSAIPTYWCARLARSRGVDCLLAGDGGDELFGGNERYRKEQIFAAYQRIPLALRKWVIEPAAFNTPLNAFEKVRNYIRTSNMGNPERYCRWRLLQKFSPDVVLGSDMPFRNGHSDLLSVIRAYYDRAPAHSELNRLLYVDVKMTLGDDDLPKVTRTAELAGINVRFPYLNHELAEFSGRLPVRLKVRNLEKRYLFKLATQQLLPQAILRKKKHGFGVPIGLWLKTDATLHNWAKDILFDPRAYQRGYFRRDFVEELFAKMQTDTTPYFGDLLWVFLALELWHRHHVERNCC